MNVIELAREAVLFVTPGYEGTLQVSGSFAGLERFAALVRAAALEEAAGVALEAGFRSNGTPAYEHIAAAIRELMDAK